jgi:hypothetical protein
VRVVGYLEAQAGVRFPSKLRATRELISDLAGLRARSISGSIRDHHQPPLHADHASTLGSLRAGDIPFLPGASIAARVCNTVSRISVPRPHRHPLVVTAEYCLCGVSDKAL